MTIQMPKDTQIQGETLRTVIVGLGNIGLLYDMAAPERAVHTHAKACFEHPGMALLAGIDPNPERRSLFMSQYSAPAYPDMVTASLSAGTVDLCIISTPTPLRLSVLKQCVALKPRIILVEKPLAMEETEARAMISLCRDHDIRLAVNYNRRFDTAYQKAGRVLREGRFGVLRHAVCSYSGGVHRNGTHFIDLFLYWLGRPLAAGAIGRSKMLSPGDVSLPFAFEYPEAHVFFLPVHGDYALVEIDLYLEQGRLRFEGTEEHLTVFTSQQDSLFPNSRSLQPDKNSAWAHPDLERDQYNVMDSMYRALKKGDILPSSGESALETLLLTRELTNAAHCAHSLS